MDLHSACTFRTLLPVASAVARLTIGTPCRGSSKSFTSETSLAVTPYTGSERKLCPRRISRVSRTAPAPLRSSVAAGRGGERRVALSKSVFPGLAFYRLSSTVYTPLVHMSTLLFLFLHRPQYFTPAVTISQKSPTFGDTEITHRNMLAAGPNTHHLLSVCA